MTEQELKVIDDQFDTNVMLVNDVLKKVENGTITRNQLERELKELKKELIHSFNYIKNEDWK